jgi:hypothetical protein
MKEIFWGRVEDARKLGSFAFVCLAIVIWVGARACYAFFQDAILHSLQEWLLSRNLRHQPRESTFNYRVLAKRDGIATSRLEKVTLLTDSLKSIKSKLAELRSRGA